MGPDLRSWPEMTYQAGDGGGLGRRYRPASAACTSPTLSSSDNTRGVRLLATDDTDNVPTGWTWTAQYRLTDTDGAMLQSLPNQTFSLSGSATLDLTTL